MAKESLFKDRNIDFEIRYISKERSGYDSENDTYRTIKDLPNKETLIDIGKINDKYFIN